MAHRTCRRCWKADSDRPAATFDATVEYLDSTETVVIATPLRAGGEARTWIWAVTVDGVPYIRSGYGHGSAWYQRALRNRRGAFLDGGHRHEVAFEPEPDEQVNQAIDRAYTAKHARRWRGPAAAMIADTARGTTLRVMPAGSPHR